MEPNKGMAILFDFDVTSGGGIVLSSLAAYYEENLTMKNGTNTKNTLVLRKDENGNDITPHEIELNNGDVVYFPGTYVQYDPNKRRPGEGDLYGKYKGNDPLKRRPGEDDLYGKYKGTAVNQSEQININLNYIIDDTTPDDSRLNVNLKDSYYTSEGTVIDNPKDWWHTHINPMSDSWDGRTHGMPDILHKFTYPYGNGQDWNFDFLHRNIKGDNIEIDNNPGTSVNKPVEAYGISDLKSDVTSGINAHTAYPEALGMAAWGTTYHYKVVINNIGNDARKIALQVKNSSSIIYGLKKEGQSDYNTWYASLGDGNNDWKPDDSDTAFWVDIPGNKITTFEVVTLATGWESGMKNLLILKGAN